MAKCFNVKFTATRTDEFEGTITADTAREAASVALRYGSPVLRQALAVIIRVEWIGDLYLSTR